MIVQGTGQRIREKSRNLGGDSVTRASKRLRVGRVALSNLLNDKAKLSLRMSAKIDFVYECSTVDLVIRQLNYDIFYEKRAAARLGLQRRWSSE